MTFSKLKTMKKDRGFTIVELLIVIVVIAILAAIVIVAYNGVTNKANSAAAKGNAEGVQKVVEAYNADKGTYPNVVNDMTAANLTAKVPANITVDAVTPTGTAADISGTHIYYDGTAASNSTGGCIAYWDVLKSGGAGLVIIKAGDATGTITSNACS